MPDAYTNQGSQTWLARARFLHIELVHAMAIRSIGSRCDRITRWTSVGRLSMLEIHSSSSLSSEAATEGKDFSSQQQGSFRFAFLDKERETCL